MVVDGVTDEDVDRLFHALADATRRDILRRCVRGEPSVSRLADAYPMSFAAVQKHVAVLERAGLVTKERRGREQLVRTDPDAVSRARQALDELETAWRGRVDRMADLLAQVRPTQTRREDTTMSVTSVEKDFDSLSLTLIADFDAPIERVWQLWADPRQLERWWGPPTHPATVEKHDLAPGGEVSYFMTGPEGEKSRGWWRVTSVDPPRSLEFTDGFANQDGTRSPTCQRPRCPMRLTEHGGGTRMELRFGLRLPRAHGAARQHGHDRGHARGGRPDGRAARRLTRTSPYPSDRKDTREMRKLIVSTFVTLDGVMQAPGGPEEDDSGGFAHGGWSVNYWDDQMGQVMGEAMSKPFDLVLGRKTYDIFAALWPHASDDAGGKPLNDATKYVASRSQSRAGLEPSVLIEGDAAEGVAALKQGDGPELQVHGSGNLIQTLLRHNLVDQFRLWVFPVVIGSGKRLFADGTIPAGLKLVDSTVSTTGVVIGTYEPAGEIVTGSFAN